LIIKALIRREEEHADYCFRIRNKKKEHKERGEKDDPYYEKGMAEHLDGTHAGKK